MASLFKRPGSAYWQIKYKVAPGKWVQRSTKFRHKKVRPTDQIGLDQRKAEQLRAEKTLAETQMVQCADSEQWGNWIEPWFALRYASSPNTHLRMGIAWRTLRIFLRDKGIDYPRQLTRDQCLSYMSWRQQPDQARGKYPASHNTALFELRALAFIMREAVLRGFAAYNPCRDLGIKGTKVRPTPEFTLGEMAVIDACIDGEPEPDRTFFRNSFDIARKHGVRISECYLNPMTAVAKTGLKPAQFRYKITFLAKGGKDHTVFLHKDLIPLFERLRKAGATETYERQTCASFKWHRFLIRIGLKRKLENARGWTGPVFHSARPTVSSALARAGVSERKAMKFLNHASTTVSRSYAHLRPEDLTDCADAL